MYVNEMNGCFFLYGVIIHSTLIEHRNRNLIKLLKM